ncbi:MAG TPA: response regulator [Burkholderiaceae bacterium]|jgi:CheY-like chemotaxis protein|nr:response regulator [Burkholderiaceae bacterium]
MSNAKTTTILVVDDSKVSRMLSRSFILHTHPDWIVEEAITGEDAVTKLATVAPDLILLDVNMPGMGGLAAIAKLREISPNVRICLMTANVQDATREKAHNLNVQFAEKPITQARIDHVIAGLGQA